MDTLEGIKKIVNILRKADNKFYCKSAMSQIDFKTGQVNYCSIGMVAKEVSQKI